MSQMREEFEATRNTSGLSPLGRAILVKEYDPETRRGIIDIPDNVRNKMAMVEQRAVVIAVGPSAWPDEPARAKPGDKVYVAKFSGFMTRGTLDGEAYRVVNDRDIFLRIDEEKVDG